MPTLHVTHGFIGFGKTFFSKKLEKEITAIRFNNDEWMSKLYGFNPNKDKIHEYWSNINDIQLELMGKLLDQNVDIIFDNGMWRRSDRDQIRAFAKEHKAICKFYKIKCDLETAKTRTLARNKINQKGHLLISEPVFNTLLQDFEPMNEDEEFVIAE